jgi:hypothetical protein
MRVRLISVVFVAWLGIAHAEGPCVYLDESGTIVSVKAVDAAPVRYRKAVYCNDGRDAAIANPQDVKLQGPAGRASLTTDLGPMEVRWPRSVEQCFGRSPARAAADAAAAVNRALKSARFSTEVKYARQEWAIVFTDRATAIREFPTALTLGGHPGFMIPPSQIYIIADFISPDCAAGGVADAVLTQVLLHEMGHAVEYVLLGGVEMDTDRQRAEGFASWFEQYSADFASIIPRGSVKSFYRTLATQGLAAPSGGFNGTAQDYAVAALAFQAIVDRKGIHGLMKVYSEMAAQGMPLMGAVEQEFGWDSKTFEREMRLAASR